MKRRTILLLLILCFGISLTTAAQIVLREQRNWSLFHTMAGSQTINSIRLSTGVQLEYAEQGNETGTAVIFLHGYTDSWHSFETVLPLLPSTIHALALTQRGHGNSSKPANGYHPKDFAADVAAFIREAKLEKAIIVGHSLGGVIAQQFALDYPELTRAVVIVSSDAAFNDNESLPEFAKEVMKLSDPVDYAFAEAFQKSTIENAVDSEQVKMFIEETMKMPAGVWKAVLNGFMSVDYTKELHKIDQPALIIWGDKDKICPRTAQDVLTGKIENARLIVYKGTGHALHWEEPERFVNDLMDFIQSIQ